MHYQFITVDWLHANISSGKICAVFAPSFRIFLVYKRNIRINRAPHSVIKIRCITLCCLPKSIDYTNTAHTLMMQD